VSSDDSQILNVAKKYGANIIKRPPEFSSDISSSEEAWLHAINYLETQNKSSDIILTPQVTSPLREKFDFDKAIDKFIDGNYDSLFSATVVNDFFFWKETQDNKYKSVNYDYRNRKRRQELDNQIIENGSFYIFNKSQFKKSKNRLINKIGCYEMDFWKMFEIDSEKDLRMCSALMNEFILRS